MSAQIDLETRMKTFYEQVPKTKLMRRCPVAIRIDGKAFRTFTRGFHRPFDDILIDSMQKTMKYLCENIQGCVLGYSQSDEITLILIDYQKLESGAWFDYEVQKIASISASMATMAFNKYFRENVIRFKGFVMKHFNFTDYKSLQDQAQIYISAVEKGAMFDARCFNIPKEEVTNLIYWRQFNATRNSVQMVGRANFSQKELNSKGHTMIKAMLKTQKGIIWENLPIHYQRGSCCIKKEDAESLDSYKTWVIDKEIPIFKGEDRKYIDDLIFVGE